MYWVLCLHLVEGCQSEILCHCAAVCRRLHCHIRKSLRQLGFCPAAPKECLRQQDANHNKDSHSRRAKDASDQPCPALFLPGHRRPLHRRRGLHRAKPHWRIVHWLAAALLVIRALLWRLPRPAGIEWRCWLLLWCNWLLYRYRLRQF